MIWNMWRKLKNMENEKHKLQDLEYGEKHWKMRNSNFRTWNMARNNEKIGKMRNAHYRSWNMARKVSKMENEKLKYRTWNMVRNNEKQ